VSSAAAAPAETLGLDQQPLHRPGEAAPQISTVSEEEGSQEGYDNEVDYQPQHAGEYSAPSHQPAADPPLIGHSRQPAESGAGSISSRGPPLPPPLQQLFPRGLIDGFLTRSRASARIPIVITIFAVISFLAILMVTVYHPSTSAGLFQRISGASTPPTRDPFSFSAAHAYETAHLRSAIADATAATMLGVEHELGVSSSQQLRSQAELAPSCLAQSSHPHVSTSLIIHAVTNPAFRSLRSSLVLPASHIFAAAEILVRVTN
jgi:hypothetical protein